MAQRKPGEQNVHNGSFTFDCENVTSSLYKLWSRLAFTALDRLHAASG